MIYEAMWNTYKRWLNSDIKLAESAMARASIKQDKVASEFFGHEHQVLMYQLNRMNQIEEGYNV